MFETIGFIIAAVCFVWLAAKNFKLVKKPIGLSDDASKNGDKKARDRRQFGVWDPVDFTYPEFSPCPQALSEMKPIPYRPFRWGDYHVTMGIRNMSWDDWIELDCRFEEYHHIKAHRIHTRGQGVIRVLRDTPGLVSSGVFAAVELVHELAEYLWRRYPTTFQIIRHTEVASTTPAFGWRGAMPIREITITPLMASYELPLEVTMEAAVRALEISSLLVQDDLALMVEGTDGRYYFQAGAICVPGFWRIEDKIGLPLEEIHTTGNVPQYKAKLHNSLERFFIRFPVDKPVIRNNYFIQSVRPPSGNVVDEKEHMIDPEELAWSTTTNGPEDEFNHDHGTYSAIAEQPKPEDLRLRSERQTLRRLPKSGAIVFTIRTYLTPITQLGQELGVPGRLASALRSWPEDVAEYKGRKRYFDVLADYMDQCHQDQINSGIIGKDEKLGQYPF